MGPTEREAETEIRELPSTDSPKPVTASVWARLQTAAWGSIQVFHTRDRDLRAIMFCPSTRYICRKLDWEQSRWDAHWHSMGCGCSSVPQCLALGQAFPECLTSSEWSPPWGPTGAQAPTEAVLLPEGKFCLSVRLFPTVMHRASCSWVGQNSLLSLFPHPPGKAKWKDCLFHGEERIC